MPPQGPSGRHWPCSGTTRPSSVGDTGRFPGESALSLHADLESDHSWTRQPWCRLLEACRTEGVLGGRASLCPHAKLTQTSVRHDVGGNASWRQCCTGQPDVHTRGRVRMLAASWCAGLRHCWGSEYSAGSSWPCSSCSVQNHAGEGRPRTTRQCPQPPPPCTIRPEL